MVRGPWVTAGYFRAGLALYRDVGSKRNIADILVGFAGLAVEEGWTCPEGERGRCFERGVRLLAAAGRLMQIVSGLSADDPIEQGHLVASQRLQGTHK